MVTLCPIGPNKNGINLRNNTMIERRRIERIARYKSDNSVHNELFLKIVLYIRSEE